MKPYLLIMSVVVLSASVGCGKVQLDLGENSSDGESPIQGLESNGEFVAAAQKGRVTANGYVVDTALGSVLSKTESETSSGFKVFSTVQGKLQSEGSSF